MVAAGLLIFLSSSISLAAPTTPEQAKQVVTGWLNQSQTPLDTAMNPQIGKVAPYTNQTGTVIYYVVELQPAGFVVVSADDLIEPIISFSSEGQYDPNPANPMYALVTADMNAQMVAVQGKQAANKQAPKQAVAAAEAMARNAHKWNTLMQQAAGAMPAAGVSSISTVFVSPFVGSRWGQEDVGGKLCYNYYTPNNYVCGCVATAMAQLMRYHQYPTVGVGTGSFTITVDGVDQTASLRGGNGTGGAYNWSLMPLIPSTASSEAERQAIGALCYDAGVSVNMDYSEAESGAYMSDAATQLINTFHYSNSILANNSDYTDITSSLHHILNPNLDAKLPVLLGISGNDGGHAIVCDGYGYNSATLYHHLNMGWSGSDDAWYALPNIDPSWISFNVVDECIYNIYKTGSGEIVSGRVTDSAGNPLNGVSVSDGTTTVLTDSHGIYAFVNVPSNTTSYKVQATKAGYNFGSGRTVNVGQSVSGTTTTGNKWGVDFVGGTNPPPKGPGDYNGDGKVNFSDLNVLSAAWNATPSSSNWNVNCDPTGAGRVGYNALITLAANWNKVY